METLEQWCNKHAEDMLAHDFSSAGACKGRNQLRRVKYLADDLNMYKIATFIDAYIMFGHGSMSETRLAEIKSVLVE